MFIMPKDLRVRADVQIATKRQAEQNVHSLRA